MHCTVIGGGGFLGSHLCELLAAQGHRVHVFESHRARYLELLRNLGVGIYLGDYQNAEDLSKGIVESDVLFHLGCTTDPKKSDDDPIFDIESNLVGSVRMLSEIIEKRIGRVVFASSGGTVYGIPIVTPIREDHPTNPISSYGITKLAIEKYLTLFGRLYGLDYVILRIGNAYGERQPMRGSQNVIGVFLREAIESRQVEIWGDGNQVRDFVYAGDIVSAMEKSMTYSGDTRILNIGSGKGYSVNEILHVIENVLHRKIEVKYLSPRQFDVPKNVLDSTAAKQCLDWRPVTDLPEGVERCYRWMMENLNSEIHG